MLICTPIAFSQLHSIKVYFKTNNEKKQGKPTQHTQWSLKTKQPKETPTAKKANKLANDEEMWINNHKKQKQFKEATTNNYKEHFYRAKKKNKIEYQNLESKQWKLQKEDKFPAAAGPRTFLCFSPKIRTSFMSWGNTLPSAFLSLWSLCWHLELFVVFVFIIILKAGTVETDKHRNNEKFEILSITKDEAGLVLRLGSEPVCLSKKSL